MATVDLVASTVMDIAASLMNDTTKTTYTYAAQLPYLKLALQELEELYELNSIQTTEVSSDIITVPAGTTQIVFNGVGIPALPSDLIEPQELWERNTGSGQPFVPMTKKQYLPHDLEDTPINMFVYWVWQSNKIIFLQSNISNDIKMDYIKNLFPDVIDQNSPINVINAKTFLEFRVAGLCAEFIERNVSSANSLNAQGILALDRGTGIAIKGKQAINTRRRPFRSAWKRRSQIR